jgi:pimeloyl-ACP methyl ester carboxylesterase
MKTKIIRVADIDIAYRVFGKGYPLIMIMGYLGTMGLWDKTILKMLSSHYKVIIFDNRGMGRTSSSARKFTMKVFADDTAGLMKALKIKRAHVLGWSMGTNIALELALRYPKKVDRLILYAADCGGRRTKSPAYRFTKKQYLPDIECTASEEEIERQTKAVDEWKMPCSRLSRIKQPTLLISGTNDTLIPLSDSVRMARYIRRAWLVQIKSGGHGLMYQFPRGFSNIVHTFLKM